MILLWLVMALMIAASLVYFFVSLQKNLANDDGEKADSFAAIRSEEIANEQEVGRLTGQEAEALLKDLESETQHAQSMDEFAPRHRSFLPNLVSTKYTLLGIFVLVSLGSVTLYQSLGYAKDVAFSQALAAKNTTPKMTLDFLKYRSERYDRAEDWYYLANDFMSSGEYAQAMGAFQAALVKLPEGSADQAEVLVRYAQAIFYNNGNVSSPEMEKVVDKVLVLEPKNATALGLKGVAAFDHKAYLKAVLTWQDAARYNDNALERQTLLGAIQSARQAGGISYQQVPALVTRQIALRVIWDKSKIQWHSDDVLLVYALAPGSNMPVAIRRVYPQDLNRPVILTNLDNLMSKQSLEDVGNVDLVVKLSKITAKDLTKGQVIGIKKAVPSNTKAIYAINVTL
ncbi:MAG: hypothetical protein WBG31_09740 [Marinomonas sp.]